MPHRNIPGALDENFIMDEMTLILMDPISGFILAEEIEEKRDAETWHKVTQGGLKGLKVTIHQFVGDEAGGLTKLATGIMNVIKGSDLFHIQQEITKGLTSHLARTLEQVKRKEDDFQKEKREVLSKLQDHLKQVDKIEELPKRGINTGKRLIRIEKEEKANRKKREVTEKQYQTAQEARRSITDSYHPFSLDTGERQNPETVKSKLEKSYSVLEAVAKEAGCTGKQKQRLEKSKGSMPSMIAVIVFFFSFLTMTINSMGLNASSATLFEELTSIQYLKLCLQRAKKKKKKEQIAVILEKMENRLRNNPLWQEISKAVQAEWWNKALECAQVFQRSSSCVEGRNGQLSLKFHAFRRINVNSLKVLTVLHNFFIRRPNGSTAAERFFGQKQEDLFTSILDKVELPRPRKKHRRESKKSKEKQVA
ncbi:MAG: hypothetical protein H0W50_04205 [Parachlamydiaceae bacterium]|nr:hypothetical protein [Parachlamydiaceae bacterium]